METAEKKGLSWLFWAFVATVGFSGVFVSMKYGAGSGFLFTFTTIAMVMNFLGNLILMMLFERKKHPFSFSRPMLFLAFVISLAALSNDTNVYLMFTNGAPISVAVPIAFTMIVLVTVVAGITLMKEKLNRYRVLGIVLALAGVVLINV